ncbi:hypothetical protein [Herbidospora sp. RD11066]
MLIRAVDRAAAMIEKGPTLFVERLRALRAYAGPVPRRYPVPSYERRDIAPARKTVEAVVALGKLIDSIEVIRPATGQVRTPARLSDVAAALDQMKSIRPLSGGVHRCRRVTVDRTLVWRGWFGQSGSPVMLFVEQDLAQVELELMYGLHAGTHLDHLTEVLQSTGPAAAARLEYGSGLLVAESVAMAAEFIAFASQKHELAEQARSFLRRSLIERIARIPNLRDHLPPESRFSPAVCDAMDLTPAHEFAALPTLAGSYVSGPFELARRRFRHPLIPPACAEALTRAWAEVIGGR